VPWPLLALLLLLLGAPRQDGGLPTREALAARLAQAEAGDEAAPEVEALRAALVDLDRREAAIARATEERAAADEVPAQVEELRRQLSGEAGEPPLPDAAELGLEAREGELARAGSALGAARAQLEELRARRGARDDRREEVLRQRAEAQKELAALEEGLGP
jgi:chromosome segregation ATPase